ncbi:MAG: MoxR-like ATPase, partial [Solirubrobacteraceae bacterium]|nr:MoxR-like ATPase [Solirubrobacteraceae bacterium]
QVDRFMVRLSLGYPDAAGEAAMLATHESGDRVASLEPVADAAELLAAQDAVARVRASEPLRQYIVALLAHTRANPLVELGASPRAGLLLLRAAKARALLAGRDHALPDDVQEMVSPVLAHRIVLAPDAFEATGEQVVAAAVAATPAL